MQTLKRWLRNWLWPLDPGPPYFHAGQTKEIRRIVQDELRRIEGERELRGEGRRP